MLAIGDVIGTEGLSLHAHVQRAISIWEIRDTIDRLELAYTQLLKDLQSP